MNATNYNRQHIILTNIEVHARVGADFRSKTCFNGLYR